MKDAGVDISGFSSDAMAAARATMVDLRCLIQRRGYNVPYHLMPDLEEMRFRILCALSWVGGYGGRWLWGSCDDGLVGGSSVQQHRNTAVLDVDSLVILGMLRK